MAIIVPRSLISHSSLLLLLALYIFPKCVALDPGQEAALDPEARKKRQEMSKEVYNRCPALSGLTPQHPHPIPEEDILKIAHRYEKSDLFVDMTAWNIRSHTNGTIKELEQKMADVGYFESIKRTWFSFLCACGFVLALLLCFLLPIMGCCKVCCCSKPCLPHYKCCVATSLVVAMLFILTTFGVVGFAGWKTRSVVAYTENLTCELYRLQYSFLFGLKHDQNKYLEAIGRDDFKIADGEAEWTGALAIIDQVIEKKKAFDAVDVSTVLSTFSARIGEVATLFPTTIDSAFTASETLPRSIAANFGATTTSLAELQTTKAHNHICPSCTVDPANPVGALKAARDAFKNLKDKTSDYVGDVRGVSTRPEIQEAKDELETIVKKGKENITAIRPLKDTLGLLDPYSGRIWPTILVMMSPFLTGGLFYSALYCCAWCKYKSPRGRKPSRVLTGCFFLSWSGLLFWVTIILLATTVMVAYLGLLGEVCVLTDEVFIDGKYENYPWIAELLGPQIGLNQTEAHNLLKGIGWFGGDGDLLLFLGIERVTTKVQDAANNAKNVFDKLKAKVESAKGKQALAWVIIPDLRTIKSSNAQLLSDAYPEVLLSGLQMERISVHDVLKDDNGEARLRRLGGPSEEGGNDSSNGASPDGNAGTADDKTGSKQVAAVSTPPTIDAEASFVKIVKLLQGESVTPDDTPTDIYGFKQAEEVINKEFSKVIKDKELCFGRVTTCHSSSSAKIIDVKFDATTDSDMMEWKDKLGSSYARIVASIEVMKWKLRLLDAAIFGADKAKYEAFLNEKQANINTLTGKLGTLATDVDAKIKLLLSDIPSYRNNHKRILAEFVTFKDSLCRGFLKPLSLAIVAWCSLGLLQIALSILGYRFWVYLKGVGQNEDSYWDDESSEDLEQSNRKKRNKRDPSSSMDSFYEEKSRNRRRRR